MTIWVINLPMANFEGKIFINFISDLFVQTYGLLRQIHTFLPLLCLGQKFWIWHCKPLIWTNHVGNKISNLFCPSYLAVNRYFLLLSSFKHFSSFSSLHFSSISTSYIFSSSSYTSLLLPPHIFSPSPNYYVPPTLVQSYLLFVGI